MSDQQDFNKIALDRINSALNDDRTPNEMRELLNGLREKLKAERVDELIEARKRMADQSNPYPHKLRD